MTIVLIFSDKLRQLPPSQRSVVQRPIERRRDVPEDDAGVGGGEQ